MELEAPLINSLIQYLTVLQKSSKETQADEVSLRGFLDRNIDKMPVFSHKMLTNHEYTNSFCDFVSAEALSRLEFAEVTDFKIATKLLSHVASAP